MSEAVWNLFLSCPEKEDVLVAHLEPFGEDQRLSTDVEGIRVTINQERKESYTLLTISAEAKQGRCYLSFACEYPDGKLLTFSGEKSGVEVFRQSPHDPADHVLDMAKEAVPMVALTDGNGFIVALSDQPGHCDNYTTQYINTDQKEFRISSGDSGETPGYQGKEFLPYYHELREGKGYEFRLAVFRSEAATMTQLRNDVFSCIDTLWGMGGCSKFHAVCFSSNYMHYRRNETGCSDFWVTPGIDYGNKQYTRDAFWQSMILPLAMEQQCYDAVYPVRYKYAECAMIFLIWSYHLQKRGGKADLIRMQDALEYMQRHAAGSLYLAGSDHDEKYDFKSWYDICAFENDDVITYNQGLFAVALRACEMCGLKPNIEWKAAQDKYNALFCREMGYFPLSDKKHCLSADVLVGDLLSYLLFGEVLTDDEKVAANYELLMKNANTPYGVKVTCAENGDYLPLEFYGANGYINEVLQGHRPGYYSWGGSYFLYEMLFHIAAYLHGVKQAEDNMIRRTKLDFSIGGTYYEHIDTVTGEGNKPNQGWNAAIYAIWDMLMQQGKASDRFFREIEKVL